MRNTMTTVAILCLLLLERFLASDMDSITQPVLNGLRALEKTAMKYTKNKDILPPTPTQKNRKFTSFYLYTRTRNERLDLSNKDSFRYFNPNLESIVIIHGFLDQIVIAKWMHRMKDEFLVLDNYNVIIVDWSVGNFLPYSQAAANTEQAGEEISHMLAILRDEFGAKPSKFHLIGHSLGAHVAGYVGERIKGLKRITGLDPATYLFKEKTPRAKLDPSDAAFVDVLHTDGGGIGMAEPVGHVDFYPNGGEIQKGCTASNSLKSLLEHGVMEGARTMICSHMRAADLFTATINDPYCRMIAYRCSNWTSFMKGECYMCGRDGTDCATMGYHIDTSRMYHNRTKYYLLTSNKYPFCGFEYKITLHNEPRGFEVNSTEWTSMDVLNVLVYGTSGNTEFKLEGKGSWPSNHVVYSDTFLGDILGSVIRWSKKPLSRAKGMKDVVSKIRSKKKPFLRRMQVLPLKSYTQWSIVPIFFDLCCSRRTSEDQQGALFRSENC